MGDLTDLGFEKAKLLYLHEIFYDEVSLQAASLSLQFGILYNHDGPVLKILKRH